MSPAGSRASRPAIPAGALAKRGRFATQREGSTVERLRPLRPIGAGEELLALVDLLSATANTILCAGSMLGLLGGNEPASDPRARVR